MVMTAAFAKTGRAALNTGRQCVAVLVSTRMKVAEGLSSVSNGPIESIKDVVFFAPSKATKATAVMCEANLQVNAATGLPQEFQLHQLITL